MYTVVVSVLANEKMNYKQETLCLYDVTIYEEMASLSHRDEMSQRGEMSQVMGKMRAKLQREKMSQ
jgi:hypothetical protein